MEKGESEEEGKEMKARLRADRSVVIHRLEYLITMKEAVHVAGSQ